MDIGRRSAKRLNFIRAIRHQSAARGKEPKRVDCRETTPHCACDDILVTEASGGAWQDEQRAVWHSSEIFNIALDLPAIRRIQSAQLEPELDVCLFDETHILRSDWV